jgi:hypothetical protein
MRLSDVIARPDDYRDRTLTFFCVFHKKDDVFAPLATPFNETRYDNVAVWPDGLALWEQQAYQQDFPFLYVLKAHPRRDQLVGLEIFTRLEVTGRIRAVFRGRPCIEIADFRLTGHRLGKRVVMSVMAGANYEALSDFELAYENYMRALEPDLPPAYDLLVRKRAGDMLRRQGRIDEARALEGGGILAPSSEPRPAPEAPPPVAAPRPTPLAGDLPGSAPAASVPRARAPDLPPGFGSPDGPSMGFPSPHGLEEPPARAEATGRDAPLVPVERVGPLSDDLPGGPSAPVARDRPGATPGRVPTAPPAAEPSPPPRPPRAPSPATSSSRTPARTGDVVRAPPPRQPRLTGVK